MRRRRVTPRGYDARVAAVSALEASMRSVSDVRAALLPGDEANTFAVVREAARRTLGLRAFDVQIAGAAAMHDGKVVEMQTGEGKTLAAVFTAVLNAWAGRGVHVLTANDYLARRDAAWMGPVYDAVGVSVGFVQHDMPLLERQRAYACDVTYATANEAGFDYLRDRLCERPEDVVQRDLAFAIVDEADSILIDEARLPLVIAGGDAPPTDLVEVAREFVAALEPGRDWEVDEHARNAYLTGGVAAIQSLGAWRDSTDRLRLLVAVNQALHAHGLLRRDVDYVVKDGAVFLVDGLKGRVIHRRRWPDGLQAAVEAKERVALTHEARVLSSITFQALAKLYRKLAGMTGTAASSAEEFASTYGLEVVVVPSNVPSVRIDDPDVVYTHLAAKEDAVVREIGEAHAKRRPVLVGTSSVEESERLAAAVRRAGMRCEVLNARDDEREAEIVALAGQAGAVTISTNMAGRGTDIGLGDGVAELGGLYVIGTNRHASVRIDNQLRGRAGRQGDPGSSRFFVSLEDPIVQQFGRDFGLEPQSEPIEDRKLERAVARAQELADALNYQARQNLWRYADIVERQRQVVHARRQDVLRSPGVDDAERRVVLWCVDEFWQDYLDAVAAIREGIHLVPNPVESFRRRVVDLFSREYPKVDGVIEEKLAELRAGADLEALGITRPGSTWSYQMGDDASVGMGAFYKIGKFFKDAAQRFVRGGER